MQPKRNERTPILVWMRGRGADLNQEQGWSISSGRAVAADAASGVLGRRCGGGKLPAPEREARPSALSEGTEEVLEVGGQLRKGTWSPRKVEGGWTGKYRIYGWAFRHK